MNDNQNRPNNLLDTTDCLEAIGVFRGWKNFLFVIIVLCLLLLQTSFWLVDAGWIPAKQGSCTGTSQEDQSQEPAVVEPAVAEPAVVEEDILDVSEAARMVAAEANEPAEAISQEPQPAEAVSQEPQQAAPGGPLFGITFECLARLVRFVNVVLVLTATLYCLTMLFGLKVSLIGRLGGINHVCRAFFLSLVMVILLLPWQRVFGCMVVGAIYSPCELAKSCAAETRGMLCIVLHYLRFSGYWLLIVLLLVLSQVRSCRWTKAILRRLEVI
jgi:hypothetical protein